MSRRVLLVGEVTDLPQDVLETLRPWVAVSDGSALEAELRLGDRLVSYGSSVIVPAALLERVKGDAYNLHAASPAYPGRDPHHFAAYDGARRYGATLHRMTPRVDAGKIVDVEWFDLEAGSTPASILRGGNEAAVRLLRRNAAKLASSAPLPTDKEASWNGPKRTRADFLRMCRVDSAMSPAEFERRLHAFGMEGRANLWTELHGRVFRIES